MKKKFGFDLKEFVSYVERGARFFDGETSQAPLAGTITSSLAAKTTLTAASRHYSRAFSYDYLGRITAASGVAGGAQNGYLPFWQNYNYDRYDNLTSRNGAYYFQPSSAETATYQNNLRPDWTYDAGGQVKHSPIIGSTGSVTAMRDWQYDAAGRMTQAKDTKTSDNSTTTYVTGYDGNGQAAIEPTSYMVRSSVLGGKVVTILDSAGNKWKTIVQVDGLTKVVQHGVISGSPQPWVLWAHTDPAHLSEVTNTSGSAKAVYDPLGNFIPFQPSPQSPPPGSFAPPSSSGLGSGFGFTQSSSTVTCTLEGRPADCNTVLLILDHGSAEQCPNNYCGPKVVHGQLSPLQRDPNTGQLGYGSHWERTDIKFTDGDGNGDTSPGKPRLVLDELAETDVFLGHGARPQTPTPLSPENVNKVKKALDGFLTERCKSFINEVLAKVASNSHKDLYDSGDLMKIAGAVKFEQLTFEGENGGQARGTFKTKDAKVVLDPRVFDFPLLILGLVVAHELSHHATDTRYLDSELAKAAYEVEKSRGFEGLRDLPTGNDEDEFSYDFSERLLDFCRP